MSAMPFRLKSTLGRNYKVDLDDTRRTKQALLDLGYFETPSYGLTDYPDEALFTAIEKFQTEYDLRRDGIMKPGGETATELGIQVASKGSLEGLKDRVENDSDETQVAQTLEVPPPGVATGGAAIGAARALTGREILRRSLKDGMRHGMSIVDQLPPALPGRSAEPEEPDNKEEFPAIPPVAPTILTQPIPDSPDSGIYIHPMPDEELANLGSILENRRGNLETQAEIDRIRDWFLAHHDGWKHIGGGHDRETGKQKKEYHVPTLEKNFKGRGLKGGNFVDLSFESPTGKIVHIQTVDVDKYGKPAQWELDAGEKIWRTELWREKRVDVVLMPKGAQLDKIFGRKKW